MERILKKTAPHLAAIGFFLLICVLYFSPQLQGKKIRQGDIMQYRAMSKEIRDFKERTGETTLWTNAMFSGMPTYQINTVNAGNNLRYVDRLLRFFIGNPIGTFFLAMISFYIMAIVLGMNIWVAVFGAVAFGFTTNHFVLFEAGHNTKLRALAYLPLITAGLLLAFKKKYLPGAVLFALGVGLDITANHVQMTYYYGLTLLIFGIAQLLFSIRQKELPHFLKASGLLLVAGILGIGAAASNLLVTYEYSRDTMRGQPILKKEAPVSQQVSSSETEGLAWNYAMQWSNGTIDLFASFIPAAAGGASQEPIPDNSSIASNLQRQGYRAPEDFKAPLYWGALPFTSGPAYFGAIIVFLFFIGLYTVKGPVKWWLALGVLLTFMLSLGKNLEWFNRLFFEYVPLYNKFRTPNSVLSVTVLLVSLLGALGLHRILTDKPEKNEALRAIYIATGITGGLALFFWLLGPSFFDFTGPNDAQLQQSGLDPASVIADRKKVMKRDALRSLLLVLGAAAALFFYLRDRIKAMPVFLIFIALSLIDLWQVGQRYLDKDDFVRKAEVENAYQLRPVDREILKDENLHYRVHDITINTYNSASTSYFHKTIGGYHAAKLQRYQDLIDGYLSQNDNDVLNMLNAKYFIFPGNDGTPQLQINNDALGNAWLVKNIRMVGSANEEFNALADINPKTTAIVHREFSDEVAGLNPTGNGGIRLIDYQPNKLTYQSMSQGEELAVFSEIWYGPRKGWKATIDGQPADIIRVNYALRGIRIPPGNHEVVMEFAPKTYQVGRTISFASSSLIILATLGVIGLGIRQELSQSPRSEPRPEPQPKQPATPKTRSTRSSRDKGEKTTGSKKKSSGPKKKPRNKRK